MPTAIAKVNLAEKFSLFQETWRPKIVGELNDTYVKVVKLKGEFVWHHHDSEAELFLVVKGRLIIKLRDGEIVLNEGEFGPQSTERPREPGRGYGLKLMVALADEVTFVRARRGSTKVLLTFRYPRDDG